MLLYPELCSNGTHVKYTKKPLFCTKVLGGKPYRICCLHVNLLTSGEIIHCLFVRLVEGLFSSFCFFLLFVVFAAVIVFLVVVVVVVARSRTYCLRWCHLHLKAWTCIFQVLTPVKKSYFTHCYPIVDKNGQVPGGKTVHKQNGPEWKRMVSSGIVSDSTIWNQPVVGFAYTRNPERVKKLGESGSI